MPQLSMTLRSKGMRDETRETLESEVNAEALMLDLRIKWFL
jgi:hypothetical protein